MIDLNDFLPLNKFEEDYGISKGWIYQRRREDKIEILYLDGSIPGVSIKAVSSLLSPVRKHKRGGFRGR